MSDEPIHRSAFLAAALSLIVPGAGQLYARRYVRAAVFLSVPLAVLILGGILLVDAGARDRLIGSLSSPSAMWLVLVLLAADLAYRLIAVVDAARCARRPGDQASRLLSTMGVLAVIAALVISHAVVIRPVTLAYDTISALGAGDTDKIDDPVDPDLASLLPDAPSAGTPLPDEVDLGEHPWTGNERLSILLIGADSGRKGYSGHLTDTLMVVTIDPKDGSVAFISIPRDMKGIPLPAGSAAARAYGSTYPSQINTLYAAARARSDLFPGKDSVRGYRALKDTLGDLYGIDIPYYVEVNLRGFRDVIDVLDGVMVDVQAPVYDTHYPTDDGSANRKLYVPPGMARMDGEEALAYARARHATSDFDRADRQQRVVSSLREQTDLARILEPGVIDGLLKAAKGNLRTDIPAEKIPALVELASRVDMSKREQLVLTPPTYGTECYPCAGGAYELDANVAAIRRGVSRLLGQ